MQTLVKVTSVLQNPRIGPRKSRQIGATMSRRKMFTAFNENYSLHSLLRFLPGHQISPFENRRCGDFPDGPVVGTLPSSVGGCGFDA